MRSLKNFYEYAESISEWLEHFNPFPFHRTSHILHVKYLLDNLGVLYVSDRVEVTLYKLRGSLSHWKTVVYESMSEWNSDSYLEIQIFEKFGLEVRLGITSPSPLQKWVFVKGPLLNVWLFLFSSKTFDRWSGKFVITFALDVLWI